MTIAAFRWLLNDEPASGWCDGPPSACQLAAAQDTGSVRWTPQYAYHGQDNAELCDRLYAEAVNYGLHEDVRTLLHEAIAALAGAAAP